MRIYPLHTYQIWIGNYNLGQGFGEPSAPQLLAEIEAPSFKVACYLYELQSSLASVSKTIAADAYVSEQEMNWFYRPGDNSNSWTGKYFETEAEAQLTF